VGSIARIENALERLEVYRDDDRRKVADLERRLAGSKMALARPFEREQELTTALSELAVLNAELDLDCGADDGALLDDTAQDEENEDVLGLDDEEAEDEDEPEM
jgi:hypothetical protein